MHTPFSFIRRYPLYSICGLFLFVFWFYGQDQWGRQAGIFPNIRRSYECWGLFHATLYPISTTIGSILYYLINIVFGLLFSLLVWAATTHYFTKGVQTSRHIFVEERDGKKVYKFAIRNNSRKNTDKNPEMKDVSENSKNLYQVFDISIFGRILIRLPKCKNYDNYSEYEHPHENQISFKLDVTEQYHALIIKGGKRLLNIEIHNSNDVVKKLSGTLCKCAHDSECFSRRKNRISALESRQKESQVGIGDLLEIYNDAYVEFIALVTGRTTLRKKPKQSKEYGVKDLAPIKVYYKNYDQWD
jgi:CRISPR/Cas system-associated protein endoribonuclease Cas2